MLGKYKNNAIIKIITNVFVLILVPFIIWMFFFDDNSYIVHKKFNNEIDELEHTISFYENKIQEHKITIEKLQDSIELERFAREKYLMKKENEEVYIIEFDTVN